MTHTTTTAGAARTRNANDVHPFDATTAHVVLQEGSLARIDLADLEDLEQRGLTGRMRLSSNGCGRSYVVMHLPERARGLGLVTVASLIVGRLPGEGVSYANGNRLDLRRCNLIVTRRGHGRQKSMVEQAASLYPADREAQAAWLQAAAKRQENGAPRRPASRHGTPSITAQA